MDFIVQQCDAQPKNTRSWKTLKQSLDNRERQLQGHLKKTLLFLGFLFAAFPIVKLLSHRMNCSAVLSYHSLYRYSQFLTYLRPKYYTTNISSKCAIGTVLWSFTQNGRQHMANMQLSVALNPTILLFTRFVSDIFFSKLKQICE